MDKPSIPKGTRDFGPDKMIRRNFIFDTIKKTFRKYGFMPLETPAMENLSVLTGKYGNEGDQLLFKVLNSGNFLSATGDNHGQYDHKQLMPMIAEKGLRYDLTVPFARFVVMNRNDITFPFKRYQIQPVWRADRPQKGRYREFYQCDADVVGTDSLICEAENLLMIHEVMHNLGIETYVVRLNNRKILSAIAEAIQAPGMENVLCVAIDKLDKIGKEKVYEELATNGISNDSISRLEPLFTISGDNRAKLDQMAKFLEGFDAGLQGVKELREILDLINISGIKVNHVEIDLTLARGLSYYTGAIFEVKALNSSITSSISGGGRYDNLTGVFGLEGVSGVGFSFGVDRIYDVMEDLSLFNQVAETYTKVLIAHFEETRNESFALLQTLRSAGIAAELYPEAAKMKKQFAYADKKQIPFVLLAGPGEVASQKYGLKNLGSGEQQQLSFEDILESLITV